MNTNSAVFSDGSKWFFWDETWTMFLGPFDTEEQAYTACDKYGEYLDSGIYPEMLQNKEWKDGEELRS
jgi:hypothetical protein